MKKYFKQICLLLILIATVASHNPTETGQIPKSSASIPNMSITIAFIKPNEGALVDDELDIVVDIDSLYEIQNVTAQVEDHTTNLVAGEYCFKPLACVPAWLGTLSLAGLERGNKVLTINVTDIFGGTGQNQRSIIYDQPPVVNISAPIDSAVARPQLHIVASCTDDDPAGCVSIILRVVPACVGGGVLASGQSSIDETISLANYDGDDIKLCFEAYDSAGQMSIQFRQVYVESSWRLEEIEQVDGYIKDITSDRIFFLRNPGGLIIRDRSTSLDTTVMANPGQNTQYGFLAPNGAIFVEQDGNVLTAIVYDWQNGTLINLGLPNSNNSLDVAGNFSIWNSGNLLYYRDLGTGTSTLIASNTGNINNDVADNGDAVYWSNTYQIFRYRANTTTQLTNDNILWNTYPSTDGTNVVYRKHTPCCNNQTYAIVMYGASGETVLAPSRSQPPEPGPDYQLNNGWVAFTKLGGGNVLQVWKRSPVGEENQISFFGTSSYIDSLGPNGEVTFINQGRLYLHNADSNGLKISSSLGKSFWLNGELFRVIGGTIFKVNLIEINLYLPLILKINPN